MVKEVMRQMQEDSNNLGGKDSNINHTKGDKPLNIS